jgi:hypothetical protein
LDGKKCSMASELDNLSGFCPVGVVIARCKAPEWVILWYHRHGGDIDEAPFAIVRQVFN